MLDPEIEARVRELRGAGIPEGDAIGQAVAERALRENPPPWLAELLADSTPIVEPATEEGEPR